MRVDAASTQIPRLPDPATAAARETAGERENDGDGDDMVKAAPAAAGRLNAPGTATKVDLLA